MTWLEEREEYWKKFDLFSEQNEPESKRSYWVYVVSPSDKVRRSMPATTYLPYRIYVEVSVQDGLVSLGEHTYWFGKKYVDQTWEEHQEIFEFLSEWELIERRRIGHEDYEYFATGKLIA